MTEECEYHRHAEYAPNGKHGVCQNSVLRTGIYGRYAESYDDEACQYRMADPSLELFEMPLDPCADIEEEVIAPRGKADET